MNCRILRNSVVFPLIFVLIFPAPPASACGPYFPITIFIQYRHPDLPLNIFASGQLGIIQPSYARSYLVVAYRYLSGLPFNSSEQQQLMELWAHRLGREDDWLKHKNDAYQEWLDARNGFATASKFPEVKRDENALAGYKPSASQYSEFENCSEDAFLTAVKTLQARSKQFGQQSEEFRSWLEAQDTVFHNCGGTFSASGALEVPNEAPKQLPPLLRSDRDYQIAAAYFYDGDWPEAERRFQIIARDPSSPWRGIAAIVAVRAKLRSITLNESSSQHSEKDLGPIDAELRSLEKEPSMRPLLPAIWRMLGYVEFRLNPGARRLELANIIEHARQRSTLREDLDDYTLLLDRAIGDESDEDAPSGPQTAATKSYGKSALSRAHSSMTDWILTFQAADESATTHALAEWNQSHSLPWLIASLSKATPQTPALSQLLEAAAAIPPSSPAYLTVSFHRARLLAQSGDESAARQLVDSTLVATPLQGLPSAANLFNALRMKLATTLDEFLQFAPRPPGVVAFGDDGRDLPDPAEWCTYGSPELQAACRARRSPPPLFDSDAATVLTEGIPTRLLAHAAASPRLPQNLRLQVAESTWVRAILLNDESVARQLAPILSSLSPALAPGLKSYVDAGYSSRLFTAVLLILHHPELHPYISAGIGRQTPPSQMDSFHDNWWCSFAAPASEDTWGSYYTMYTHINGPLLTVYPDKKLYSPDFLSNAEKISAQSEWDALTKLDTAPNWLASQVLSFAKSNPRDPRVPESLHYIVRATHLGCTDVESKRYSKATFQLLHSRYPHNEWTEKTPYWY